MPDTTIKQTVLHDEVLLIDPGVTLDNDNAHTLVSMIMSAHERGFKYVIIDMSGLEFLSSAGVGSVLGTVELFREGEGDILLCSLSENVQHVLEVLDLQEYLTIIATRREAESIATA